MKGAASKYQTSDGDLKTDIKSDYSVTKLSQNREDNERCSLQVVAKYPLIDCILKERGTAVSTNATKSECKTCVQSVACPFLPVQRMDFAGSRDG